MTHVSENILSSSGGTPLVRLSKMFPPDRNVYAKLESANPGGSMKDRSATLIISELLRTGKIEPGGTIIESSSGNMAVGLAQACLFYGLKLIVVVDPKLNPHTRKLLLAYRARLEHVAIACADGGFLAARLHRVGELLDLVPGSVWSNQYGNPNNPAAYHTLMKEVTHALDMNVDFLFLATSTCGSLMGCADFILENGLGTKLIAVDAEGSILFGGSESKRWIPGHGSGVPSNFLDRDKIFDVVHVNDADCILGCRGLLQKEAILAGGSSGALVAAYQKYFESMPEGAVSVLIFADRGERYLDTVYSDDWVSEHIDVPSAYGVYDTVHRTEKKQILFQ